MSEDLYLSGPLEVGNIVTALHAVSRYLSILVRAPLCALTDRSICDFVFPSNRPLCVLEAVGSMLYVSCHYVGMIVSRYLNSSELKPDAPCTSVLEDLPVCK